MSTFATLYGLSKFSNGAMRIGINFKQFQILSSAFPYFESHFKEFLMDSWYCGLKPSQMNNFRLYVNETIAVQDIEDKCKSFNTEVLLGHVIYLPPYLNSPKIYYTFYHELKVIFQLNKKILVKSQTIISKTVPVNSSALIGIHVRSNDYIMYLKNMNAKPIGQRYFQRAISHFRRLYKNPVFLVVSDSKQNAMNLVLKPQHKMSKYLK